MGSSPYHIGNGDTLHKEVTVDIEIIIWTAPTDSLYIF